MNAKHQFKYTYNDTNLEDFSPVEITFDVPRGDVTIQQMLYNFECYLKACGFVFDGHLEVVNEDSYDGPNISDELDGTLYVFEDEPQGGCMADFDKECGCETISSPLENDTVSTAICEADKKLNENFAKMEEYKKAIKEAEDKYPIKPLYKKVGTLSSEAEKEVKKNKWVHGMCNPPADDAKEHVENYKSAGKKYNYADAIDAYSKWLKVQQKISKDSQLY